LRLPQSAKSALRCWGWVITPNVLPGSRYSFTGALKAPRQILQGGYITWTDPQTDEVQQLLFFGKPKIKNLGRANGASLRVFVDAKTRSKIPEPKASDKSLRDKREEDRAYTQALNLATEARFKRYV
jgi:hypothetical protein